jgi:hypothetical protein
MTRCALPSAYANRTDAFPFFDISPPPTVDLVKDLLRRRPSIDRQSECRFGDEVIAFDRFERRHVASGVSL